VSVVRVGATKQYSDNWDNIFSGGNPSSAGKRKSAARPARKSAKKAVKAAKKAGIKKRFTASKRKRK
jgi:hypothetical protein